MLRLPLLCFLAVSYAQKEFLNNPVVWCTLSKPEYDKCLSMAQELRYYASVMTNTHKELNCIQRSNHDECMILLDQRKADVVSLDANEVFLAGRYHSLVPIMKEIYPGNQESYFSVAVLRKGGNLSHIQSLAELEGSVACFPSVSSMAGWIRPISTLISKQVMRIVDCNNHVKSASRFFSGGCAVNVLTNKYNPLGDNDMSLCSACGSERQGIRCSSRDPYAGYVGALKCLVDKGDIAFVKHNTIMHTINHYNDTFLNSADDFELLCLDGRRVPVTEYRSCNWGEVPANALTTSSAKTKEERDALQEFLRIISREFSAKPDDPKRFHLFESYPRYGQGYDLLVSDDAERLVEVISTQQSFQVFLPQTVMDDIEMVRSCPVNRMVICVISYPELNKCLQMKIALEAQLLKPKMECLNGNSQIGCMLAIKNGEADVALMEAGDIYTAGLKYDLIPIMAERYNLETTDYYVVAVSLEDDPDTDVVYLKDRYTCHPGVMHGGGWVIPMAYLLNNDLIRGYGCNSVRAASEYFQKSCVPGVLANPYNQGVDASNLCHLCRGTLSGYCARDHTEPLYGFTGAFRCLVEGGGNIAFLKHTTVNENTDGKRTSCWARNTLTADYQLVCRDGTRAAVGDYEDCNLGKVRANAVITRGGYSRNETEIEAYTNLLLYTQQLFGRDLDDEWNFQMFRSREPYADLIFQDATQQIVPLDKSEQHYHPYLGQEFLNARYRVDCTAGCSSINSILFVPMLILCYIMY